MVGVVGGGALLGLALALGYVLYWSPRLQAEAAQEEVLAWGAHWKTTRQCILGQAPQFSDPMEALLVREMTESGFKQSLHKCVNTLKALRRVEGGSSENEGIEQAWYGLRIPVAKLAQELAWRTASTPNKSAKKLRLNLGKALAGLDAGYAMLRRSAALKPQAIPGSPLPSAEPFLDLRGPAEGAEAKVSMVKLSAAAITYRATSKDGVLYRAKLEPGSSEVGFKALSPLSLRSVDGDWGLWLEDDGIPLRDHQANQGAKLVAGPLDVQGEPAGDGTVIHTLAEGEKVELRFAMGQEQRTALFRMVKTDRDGSFSWAYRLLVSTDAGKSWERRKLPANDMWTSLRETGESSYIISTDPGDSMTLRLMVISPAGIKERKVSFPGQRDPNSTWPPDQCMAATRLWWVLGDKLYTMGADGELVAIAGKVDRDPSKFSYQFLCGDSYAAIHGQPYGGADRGLQYQACGLEGCDAIVQSTARAGDANIQHVFHKGEWYTVAQLDSVLALWRGGNSKSPAKMLHLEMEGSITSLVSWGDALLFLVWPEDAKGPTLLRAK